MGVPSNRCAPVWAFRCEKSSPHPLCRGGGHHEAPGRCAMHATHRPLKPQRQPTPQSTIGILSNSNVRLDERIDLLDFLENETDNNSPNEAVETSVVPLPGTTAAVVYRGPTRPTSLATCSSRRAHSSPQQQTALQLALEVESQSAMQQLTDDVPPAAPWHLQALICLCFPTIGVESTMRTLCPWMPPTLQERVSTCLSTLDRAHLPTRPWR